MLFQVGIVVADGSGNVLPQLAVYRFFIAVGVEAAVRGIEDLGPQISEHHLTDVFHALSDGTGPIFDV